MIKSIKFTVIASALAMIISGCDFDSTESKTQQTNVQPVSSEVINVDSQVSEQQKTSVESTDFGSLEKNASYALGYLVAQQIKSNQEAQSKEFKSIPALDLKLVGTAFNDVMNDKSQFNDEQAQQYIQEFQEKLMKLIQEEQKAKSAEQLQKGKDFLTENAKKDGVKVTESGLQYKVNVATDGDKPTSDEDIVTVMYTGKLIDGTVFDSNMDKDPIEFPLNRVIKGWTEGLKLMSVDSDFTFYIPSELGYGAAEMPGGRIPANSVLIFDVKLLKVQHANSTQDVKENVEKVLEDKTQDVKENVEKVLEDKTQDVKENVEKIINVDE